MKLFCINLVFLVCSIFSTHTAIAQKRAKTDTLKKRPTVALVLSGGGAKGFAEIGTLEVIDELGIPIDYIVGTSMGSAMGAFYAIGYTGKEIAKEVAKQDWSTAFTDKIVSRKTPISRKEELSRYALSFPIRGGIHLPKGIVRGQEIMNILSKYTVGYQDSLNFKKFPIPYSCVVTDLETGESIVLESGNLTQAIRASMSIPSVFTPTEIGERVFIDGGVVNNFPTDIAKIEGYDFIIGVDVQTPLLHKKDLVSAKDIAYQLLGFLGKKRNDDNIKLTDVYIHPNISKYTTSSFAPAEVDSLIEIGRKAARKAYPQLVKLKEKLGKNVSKEKHTTPNFNAPLFFNHIKVGGLKKISQKLFMQKIDLKDINSITTTDLKSKIDDVSASLDLDLLTYQLSQDTLRFIAHERNQNRFNVGLHYDSDNNASILLNTTWNNLLFKHSRASFDAILGKNLQFTARYTLKFGDIPHLNLMFDTKKYDLTLYDYNDKLAEGTFNYFKFDANTQFIVWDTYSAGIGIRQEFVHIDQRLSYDNNYSSKKKIHKWYTNYYGFIRFNTLDNHYYPKSGSSFEGEAKFLTDGISEKGIVLYGNYKAVWNLMDNFDLIFNLYERSLIDSNVSLIYSNYWGGGIHTRFIDRPIPFMGTRYAQGYNKAMGVGRLDFRYELFRNNYLVFTGNYGRHSNTIEEFLQDTAKNLWGAGLTYSYNSIIGPIEFTVMHSNIVHRPLLHISIGYNF